MPIRDRIIQMLSKSPSGNVLGRQPSLINYKRLLPLVGGLSSQYRDNKPFPHIVIDDFLDEDIFAEVAATFPGPDDLDWLQREASSAGGKDAQVRKLDFSLGRKDIDNEYKLAPILRYLLLELNSPSFLRLLQRLTGISPLIADPRMWGGGLHQTLSGGMLRIHADFMKHPDYGLDRRLNVLLFANDNWQDSYGGDLELWDQSMSECVESVAPIGNRCVIFTTSKDSYHGYTQPITCPETVTRKSLAMYYYTVPAGIKDEQQPITDWQDLPAEKNS